MPTEHETAIVAKKTEVSFQPEEDTNTDPTWSKHPLLTTVIWLLGGYPDPLQQSNSGGSLSQGHGSGDSLRDSKEPISWGSKDSLMISEGDGQIINHGAMQLKPKIMKIVGEDENDLKTKDIIHVEDGSPSCSPSWGWYVSTGTTPQSGAASTNGRQKV